MNFLSIESKEDLCKFLQVSSVQLEYILLNTDRMYTFFNILKKNGSSRKNHAPNLSLIKVQNRIKEGLESCFKPKKCVHAFVQKKDIKSNARRHARSSYVMNIDLKDFFATITFNRVVGLLKSKPYCFNEEVSQILGKLVCYQYRLPQGAPARAFNII